MRFSGLPGIHSHCGSQRPPTSCRGLFSECFSPFIISWTAPCASDWTESCRVGLNPDGIIVPSQSTHNIFVERLWPSVKYQDIYLRGYGHVPELMVELAAYFEFYNSCRLISLSAIGHQHQLFLTGQRGGACIVDRHPKVAA